MYNHYYRKSPVLQNILLGLFDRLLICSECGTRLSRQTSPRDLSVRYKCKIHTLTNYDKQQRRCSNHFMINEKQIEKYLLDNIQDLINTHNEKVIQKSKKQKQNFSQNEIKELKNKLLKLKELYINNLINLDDYKKDYEKYNNRLEELSNFEEQKGSIYKPIEAPSDFKSAYLDLNRDNQRRIWMTLLDKIYIENKTIKEVIFL